MIVNLLPYQILQPFVDAAFKKRGIDPEHFWRNAGLPAFQFPDPNGQRQPERCAAAGADACSRARRNILAPPCRRARRARTPRRPTASRSPANPLPCARPDRSAVRRQPVRPNYPPPDVLTSAPNPNAPRSTPGLPSAAVPGETSPALQGIPVPLRARARRVRARYRSGRCPGPCPPPAGAAGARSRDAAAGTGRTVAGTTECRLPGNPPFACRIARGHGRFTDRCRRSSTSETSSCRTFLGRTRSSSARLVLRRTGRRSRRLPALQAADQHHRRRVLPSGARAVSRATRCRSWACRVGSIDKIEPAGDKMKVTFHYDNKYKVPADATASILNPSLVASRTIQLSPPYTGGPVHGGQRGDPDRAHPGAGGVGRPAQPDHRHRQPARAHTPSSRRGRSATSSSPSPTGWTARASRSTPP